VNREKEKYSNGKCESKTCCDHHQPLPLSIGNVEDQSGELAAYDISKVIAGGPETHNETARFLWKPIAIN
jgi:hypothetical protein